MIIKLTPAEATFLRSLLALSDDDEVELAEGVRDKLIEAELAWTNALPEGEAEDAA